MCTVHLLLYQCITCKVNSCLSNYCTFHISYVTTNTKYKITFMKKVLLVDILSLLLVRPKIFINITSDVFIVMHRGKSAWMPHISPAMISDVLTCSIRGIQQRRLILCSMIIYFPPPFSNNGSDCAVGNIHIYAPKLDWYSKRLHGWLKLYCN